MQLKTDSFLQGGKYRIERVLGQGGFGITYLGTQVGLNRRVAIKEFFMKEYCNRDGATSHVSVPSTGSKELVDKFRTKFVKEAQTIAEMENNHIIRIHDIFEENGTAYYVMEYLPNDDLRHRIPVGGMAEEEALSYIRQVGDALSYIHDKNILHLDVKPGNILFRQNGEVVLIDFGISKHYDGNAGSQTSSTPVGISEGYAPTEQYDREGISSFSAATDVYALGATLYCLLNGERLPKASVVLNEGLPALPSSVSSHVRQAVERAMAPRRKDRPQSIREFLALLDGEPIVSPVADDEETTVVTPNPASKSQPKPQSTPQSKEEPKVVPVVEQKSSSSSKKSWIYGAIAAVVGLLLFVLFPKGSKEENPVPLIDTLSIASPAKPVESVQPTKTEPVKPAQVSTPVQESAPAPSLLYVTTTPSGAVVTLDGKRLGTTPLSKKEVSAGKHTVKITSEGYEPYSKKLTFVSGEPVILNETLKEKPQPVATVQQPSSSSSSSNLNSSSSSSLSSSSASSLTGTINGHEYVDLGLSVKWATCNVGASSPSAYGNYYAWGETTTKSEYRESNSVTYEKSMSDIRGNRQYDTARANWGGSWRLPTKSEMEELKNQCTWTWTTQGGTNGYKVTSKKNGKSIFLPAAGWRYGTSLDYAGEYGYYWTSAPIESNPQRAYRLYFNSSSQGVLWDYRYYGYSVRPVTE